VDVKPLGRARFNSFRLRLSLVVALIFVPILILRFWVEETHRAQLIQDAQHNALTLTESLANDYRQYIESGRQLLTVLAQLPVVRNRQAATCSRLLISLLKEYPAYVSIFVSDASTGMLVCSGRADARPIDNSQASWFKEALNKRDFVVSEYRIGPQTGMPIVTMAYPIEDDDGKIVAVAAAGLSLQWLNAFVQNTDIPENAALTVVDAQGTVLVRYPERPELIGQPMPIEAVRQAALANARGITQAMGLEGAPRIYAYTSIAPGYGNIHVILSVPESLILADANVLRQQSLFVLGVIIALGILGAWLTGSSIIRPINDLKRTIQRIASGELSSRTQLRAETAELQSLSLAFNDMAAAIENRMAAQVEQLSAMNQERSRLLAAEQRARERAENTIDRLELLQELTAHFSAALEPAQVADIITRELPEGVGAHIGLAYVLGDEQETLLSIMSFGGSEAVISPYRRVTLSQHIPVTDAFNKRQPVWFESKEDYLTKYPHMAETQALSGTQAAIALPLIIGGETIGAMLVSFHDPRAFSDEDIAFFQATAQQCAQALQRVQLLQAERDARQEAEQTAEDIALLQTVTEALGGATTVRDVARITIEQTVTALGASTGDFHLYHESENAFELFFTTVKLPKEKVAEWRKFPADPAFPVTDVLRNKRALWFRSATETAARFPAMAQFSAAYPGASALLPILVGSRALGAVSLVLSDMREFSPEEQALAFSIVHQCGQALERVRLYEEAQLSAAIRERQRLARDLHDAVSQTLFSATMIAESIPRLWQRAPDKAMPLLHQVHTLTKAASAEMRVLLWELRPEALEKTSLEELLSQLTSAVRGRKQAQVSLDTQMEQPEALPNPVHVAFYRITQEALNNVVKHAQARHVQLSLRSLDDRVEICIEDDGQGFDTGGSAGGLGMGTMRERAEAIGAALDITSTVGSGTQVVVRWRRQPAKLGN
jgi:signal transduction histidine kinase/HAMP domain-containing protein